jgi:hypothetical protein
MCVQAPMILHSLVVLFTSVHVYFFAPVGKETNDNNHMIVHFEIHIDHTQHKVETYSA